jgi:hypothetical protein
MPDGFELCRELRARGGATPVLMLTALATVDYRITGLDAGADDYLTKPFAFGELLAWVRALLRREPRIHSSVFKLEDLVVDSASHRVSRGAREIELTAKEYALLEYLARRSGQLVLRAEIAEHVWDESFDPFSNTKSTSTACGKRLTNNTPSNSSTRGGAKDMSWSRVNCPAKFRNPRASVRSGIKRRQARLPDAELPGLEFADSRLKGFQGRCHRMNGRGSKVRRWAAPAASIKKHSMNSRSHMARSKPAKLVPQLIFR